jgi:hypothetical protein
LFPISFLLINIRLKVEVAKRKKSKEGRKRGRKEGRKTFS